MKRNLLLVVSLCSLGVAIAAPPEDVKPPTPPKSPAVLFYDADRGTVGMGGAATREWIGVRLTPVPAPLRAHLGRDALMIGNVFVGSPADQAGVQQYDVLVSFNGESINEMQDLVDAIVALGAGNGANLVVLRGGREQTLTVTPAERPADSSSLELKYEEPAGAPLVDQRYFGHRLQNDPNAGWVLQPLGPLQRLPADVQDQLRDLGSAPWQAWLDDIKDMQNPFMIDVQRDPDDRTHVFVRPPTGDTAENVEISVREVRDGATIAIRRSADGKIQVERTDAAGTTSSAAFESVDALRDADADAYRVYRRYTGYGIKPIITLPPTLQDLPELRLEFQQQLEQNIEQLMKDGHSRIEQSMKDAQRAIDRARELTERFGSSGSTKHQHSESLQVSVDDEGRVQIERETNGKRESFQFDSLDALRNSQPELYERVAPLIDGHGSGRSRAALRFAAA